MVTIVLAIVGLGAEPSPREAAAIQREQAKAEAAIAEKHGNRKPAELSTDERRAIIREQAEAERRILEEHGVSPKEWVHQQAFRSPQAQAEVNKEEATLAEKERTAAAPTPAPAPAEAPPVATQRGFDEERPVVLEEVPGDGVVVEKGLPPEVDDERRQIDELERLESSANGKAAKPASKASTGERKAR